MEILNLRKTKNGYLINGHIETIPNDENWLKAKQWVESKKELMPEATLHLLKLNKVNKIKQNCTAKKPLEIEVKLLDNTIENITFVGGDESASAIRGAIDLAKLLNEDYCKIWDINKKTWEISFEQTAIIMQKIAHKYREETYQKNDKIQEILNCTTIEELENVEC